MTKNKKIENLTLGPLVWDDWREYLKWINQPQMMRLLDRHVRVTEKEHRKYFLRLKKDTTQKFLGIFEGKTKVFIGVCALRRIDKRIKKAELYICLNPKRKGKGRGLQAVKQLLDYGFDRLKLNRIYLYTPAFNTKALACYKKAGFVKEGEFLEDVRMGGKYYNAVRMCYLKKFRSRRKLK